MLPFPSRIFSSSPIGNIAIARLLNLLQSAVASRELLATEVAAGLGLGLALGG